MAAQAASFFNKPFAGANRARFFGTWLRTNRASHPSGSSDRRCFASALAA